METEELDFTKAQLDRMDEIDNTCFAVALCALERKTCLISFFQNCCTLARVMTERYDDDFITDIDSQGILAEIMNMVIDEVDSYVDENGTETDPMDNSRYIEWNMEYIGDIADEVSRYLVFKGYPVRYPYMTEDENGNEVIYDYVTIDY